MKQLEPYRMKRYQNQVGYMLSVVEHDRFIITSLAFEEINADQATRTAFHLYHFLFSHSI